MSLQMYFFACVQILSRVRIKEPTSVPVPLKIDPLPPNSKLIEVLQLGEILPKQGYLVCNCEGLPLGTVSAKGFANFV